MQRLKVFLLTAINAVYAKFKNLALHIFKHPLSSIWWVVKMYFALMFLSLFVACSFGAFASTQCPSGSQFDATHGCIVEAPITTLVRFSYSGISGAPSPTVEKAFASWASLFNGESKDSGISGYCAYNNTHSYSATLVSIVGSQVNFNIKNTYSNSYSPTIPDYPCPKNNTSSSDSLSQGWPTEVGSDAYCPPDAPYADFLSMVMVAGVKHCAKSLPPQNQCFKDPKYSIANQYHFAPEDQGKGNVCVPSDNGQLCQWKELTGSNGVFQPDTDAPDSACDDKPPSNPLDPVPPPPDCKTTLNGLKVCQEDANQKCTANSSGALDCPESCGYYNNQFVCFENPQDPPVDPEEPEEPDTPRPPADDNIENPDKPLQDMLKKDFKDVQRGVETRLDGFAADMANLLKAEKKSNDDANKSNLQSNKLLNSINQNTGDTVKELKKLTEPGEAVSGIEKPEFEEKNDWQVRNFGTVMKAKGDEIMNLPIMQAINNFFDVSFSGSCPTYAVSVWVFEINIDQFCSPQVQGLFPYISAVVLLMCSFFAIRIALL